MDETMENFVKAKHPVKMPPLKPYSAKGQREDKERGPKMFSK
jgi:hypothetical protein